MTWFVTWLSGVLYGFCLPFGLLFLLCLFVGSSVLWCLIKLIWGCLQISSYLLNMMCSGLWALELFCQLLNTTGREFVQINTSSVIVLDTNSSSHKKNQKMSQCNIFTVSEEYFVRFTCTCTALYHSSMLLFPWWKLVKRSNWAGITVYKNLHTSPKLCQNSFHLWITPRIHTDPFQSCQTKW